MQKSNDCLILGKIKGVPSFQTSHILFAKQYANYGLKGKLSLSRLALRFASLL